MRPSQQRAELLPRAGASARQVAVLRGQRPRLDSARSRDEQLRRERAQQPERQPAQASAAEQHRQDDPDDAERSSDAALPSN